MCKHDEDFSARDPELSEAAGVNHLRENFVRDGGVYGGAHRVGVPGSTLPRFGKWRIPLRNGITLRNGDLGTGY